MVIHLFILFCNFAMLLLFVVVLVVWILIKYYKSPRKRDSFVNDSHINSLLQCDNFNIEYHETFLLHNLICVYESRLLIEKREETLTMRSV